MIFFQKTKLKNSIFLLNRVSKYRFCILQNKIKTDTNFKNSKIYPNIPQKILDKIGQNLHENSTSPIGILREKIENYFRKTYLSKS